MQVWQWMWSVQVCAGRAGSSYRNYWTPVSGRRAAGVNKPTPEKYVAGETICLMCVSLWRSKTHTNVICSLCGSSDLSLTLEPSPLYNKWINNVKGKQRETSGSENNLSVFVDLSCTLKQIKLYSNDINRKNLLYLTFGHFYSFSFSRYKQEYSVIVEAGVDMRENALV